MQGNTKRIIEVAWGLAPGFTSRDVFVALKETISLGQVCSILEKMHKVSAVSRRESSSWKAPRFVYTVLVEDHYTAWRMMREHATLLQQRQVIRKRDKIAARVARAVVLTPVIEKSSTLNVWLAEYRATFDAVDKALKVRGELKSKLLKIVGNDVTLRRLMWATRRRM